MPVYDEYGSGGVQCGSSITAQKASPETAEGGVEADGTADVYQVSNLVAEGGAEAGGISPSEVCQAHLFFESDPSNNYEITCNRVDVSALRRDIHAYIYKDYGANFFGTKFRHELEVMIGAGSDPESVFLPWAIANVRDDAHDWVRNNNEALGVLLVESGGKWWLRLRDHKTYTTNSVEVRPDIPYYLRIVRDGSALSVDVYTDEARTVLYRRAVLTISAITKYRYIYRANSFYSDFHQDAKFYGYTDHLNMRQYDRFYAASGGMTFGGVSDWYITDYGFAGTGGMTLGGAAGTGVSDVSYVGSGGLYMEEESADHRLRYVADGGMTFGGSADSSVKANFSGTGGPVFAGAADTGVSDVSEEGSGGMDVGGSGEVRILYEADGGASFGGAADVSHEVELEIGGGAVAAGEAVISFDYAAYEASGGMELGGSAESRPIIYVDGSGGMDLGGAADTTYYLSVSQEFTWHILNPVDIVKDFGWAVESDIRYWYRVESECLCSSCETTGINPNDEECCYQSPGGAPILASMGQKYVQVVPARSVRNLCELISDTRFPFYVPALKWKIKSIKKYSHAMRLTDNEPGWDNCITLEEQEFCSIPECAEFCLETGPGAIVHIGVSASLQDVFYFYEGTGGMELSGSASDRYGPYRYVADGGMMFGGSADHSGSYVTETMSGGISAGGEAATEFTNWIYEASGGMTFGGAAAVTGLFLPYEGSGGMTLYGSAEETSDLGALVVDIGVETEISDLGANFNFWDTNPTGLTIDDEEVRTQCECGRLSMRAEVYHNFGDTHKFIEFTTRNQIAFPENFDLLWKTTDRAWQKTFHYAGLSENGIDEERWRLVFQWGCTDSLDGQQLAEDVWRFSVLFTRHCATNQDYFTRLIFAFPNSNVCRQNNLDITFTLNTESGFATTSKGDVVDYSVVYDEIGLFKGARWLNDPNLRITITEGTGEGPWPQHDISSIFPQEPILPTPTG